MANVPGLKIAMPATPADAKGMLKAAIRDPNPVLFLEHKGLCPRNSGPVPEGDVIVPLGRARIARAGRRDVTVIGLGATVMLAERVAAELAAAGIEIEVLSPAQSAAAGHGHRPGVGGRARAGRWWCMRRRCCMAWARRSPPVFSEALFGELARARAAPGGAGSARAQPQDAPRGVSAQRRCKLTETIRRIVAA